MKKRVKSSIVIALICLIPIPIKYKDGGSIQYRAILYDITKYHRLDIDSETGYKAGWDIKIVGIPIYNNFE